MFFNNSYGEGRGGMAMIGEGSETFEQESVTFSGTSAEVAGGSVLVAGVGVGL